MKLTPTQKERLKRPRPVLFLIVVSIFSLPWALLLITGVKARHQRAQMDLQAASFFAQQPTYTRNPSAEQFDRLAAELGFPPNDTTGLNIRVNREAAQAHETIRRPLSTFLRAQATKTAGTLDAPPPELKQYLDTYGNQLKTIQTHLLEQPIPEWDMTYERMVDPNYPFPGFFNVRNVQELLLLSAINYHYQQQPAEMTATLEASWQLNQALLQRPDLTAQVSVSAVAEYQAGLLRHLDSVPTVWIERLKQQEQQQSVVQAHVFETWLLYKIQQHLLTAAVYQAAPTAPLKDKLQSTLIYWFSPAYIMQLKAIDTAQAAHRSLDQLSDLEVCSTTQQMAQQAALQETTADWNSTNVLSAKVVAKRWKVAGDRALALELTQKILEAKQHLQVYGTWPEAVSEQASTTCATAHWVYTHDLETKTLSISLDQMPAPTVYELGLYPGRPVPFQYQATQAN